MWLLDYTNFNENILMKMRDALIKNNIKFDFFGYNRSEDSLYFPDTITDNETIIIRPTIQALIKIMRNDERLPMYDRIKYTLNYHEQRFDQAFYIKNIDLPYLNKESKILTVSDLDSLDVVFDDEMFFKSTSDLKFLTADMLSAGVNFKDLIIKKNIDLEKIKGKQILFSPRQKIKAEYRFIMIDDEIGGFSSYIVDGMFNIKHGVPDKVKVCAIEYAKVYQPSKIFTLDLCEKENGDIDIVEYNCWNTSGFYNINLNVLFEKINRCLTL